MDLRKQKDSAAALFSKGKFAKSAEAYEAYCKADPKDLQARLRMGDAWAKAGQKDRAILAYHATAEGFARDGFLPRAIAAAKLVLELDPAHHGVQQMLADLYAKKGGAKPKTTEVPAVAAASRAVMSAERSSSPAAKPPPAKDAPRGKHGPIDLPPDEPAAPPPSQRLDGVGSGAMAPRYGAKAIDLPPDDGAMQLETTSAARPALAAAAPGPAAGGRSIELPPDDGPIEIETTAPAKPAGPPPPPAEVAEIEVEVGGPPTGGVEIELVAGQPVTGEIEVPIEPTPSAPPPPPRELEIDVSLSPPPPPPPPPEAIVAGELVAEPEPVALPGAQAAPPEPPADLSQPRTVRLGEAPAERPDTVVLRAPKIPPALAPGSGGLSLDDELAAAEPELPGVALPPRSSPSSAGPPPGLRPKRPDAVEPPRASPSRLWLPPQAASSTGLPLPVAPVPPSVPPSFHAPAPITRDAPLTDLEKSLEAFSRFDDLESFAPAVPQRAPPPPPAQPPKPARPTFTELDLDEGDSLLHAVEAAAEASGAAAVRAAEELLDTPDEGKPEPGDLPKIPLFSDLPEDAFIALFEECPLRRFQKGEVIIEQGSQGRSFFVICAGRVRVFRTDEKGRHDLATLEEGTFFGEMAFLSDAPRSASVEAFDDDETQALEISAEILQSLSRKYPSVAAALKKFYRQRLLSNLMNSAKLFQALNKADRRTVVARFKARDVPKGEVLIAEGTSSDGLYVVLSGSVDVVVKTRTVAALKEGDVFGEMSLLTRSPATATVRANKRTSLLRLPREDFDSLIMVHPEILTLVAELSDARTRANAALAKPSTATAEMV